MAARNVLVDVDKTCKITDFGLALIRDKFQYLYCTAVRKVRIFDLQISKQKANIFLERISDPAVTFKEIYICSRLIRPGKPKAG